MPNERLLEIYRAHPELNMLEVIDKYASDEFKAMLEEDPEEVEIY